MRTTIFKSVLISVFIAIISPAVMIQAAPSCHCFRQREYEPRDRFAADDYLLATSGNSLLARYFNLEKKDIVFLKMKDGIGENELLPALWIGRDCGRPVSEIIERHQSQTWPEIIDELRVGNKWEQNNAVDLETRTIPDQILLEMLRDFYNVKINQLSKLEKQGFNGREINLLLFLKRETGTGLDLLVEKHLAGQSWSEICVGFGFTPQAVGKRLLYQ